MTRLWRQILDRLTLHPPRPSGGEASTSNPPEAPAAASGGDPPDAVRVRRDVGSDLPHTYRVAASDGVDRPRLFDPALKHYPSAFRPGGPVFARPEAAAQWQQAQRLVTDHVLRAMAESPHGDHLVLRGSRLLRAWFGDAAREPGDLDWVARPATVRPSDHWAVGLLTGLMSAVANRPNPPDVVLRTEAVAADDIWTYERAEGRRLAFPWLVSGLPGGTVQVDVVFGEGIPESPARTVIPTADGEGATVWAASPGQSLAWKLLWLETDMHPQGKDLYDAALLAGAVFLPRSVLDRTLRAGSGGRVPDTAAELVGRWAVEWEHFQREYPSVVGGAAEWRDRLATALTPTFAGCEQPGRSRVMGPGWKTSVVLALARGICADRAFDRLPILADALEEAGCDDTELLTHCRANGPHGKDCWVTDWLLGGESG